MSTITMIEKQKRNKSRYSIYVDDKFSLGVDENTLIKYELRKGKEIDENFLEDVIKAEEQNKANNYAINLLSYRARSEMEIKEKMKSKEYESYIIDNTINYLKQNKYLDDKAFAISFTKDKKNFKKIGEQRIKQELFYKGIDKDTINDVLDELIDKDEEYKTALELALKKIKTSYKNDDKNALYRKLGGFLQRKGYSYEVVSRVLKETVK